MRVVTFRALWLVLLLAAVVQPVRAQRSDTRQVILGRLIDDATRAPVAHGSVQLLNLEGRTLQSVVADSLGRFRLLPPIPGEYRLRAEMIGYRTGESERLRVLAGDTLTFNFWLSTRAVLLAPIEVTASSRPWEYRYLPAGLEPFYDRKRIFEALGARFFTRSKVAEFEGLPLSALLMTVVGVHPDGAGGVTMARCGGAPRFFLNGMPLRLEAGESIDQFLSPAEIEAVEVYRGAASLPGEFGGTDSRCGAIVLWTRRTH